MGTEANRGRTSETNLGMRSETHTEMESRDGRNEIQPGVIGVGQRDTGMGQRKAGGWELDRHLDKGRNRVKRQT